MNLGSDDNSFFLIEGWSRYFGRRRKKQMKWEAEKKGTVWSPTSQTAPVRMKCRFLQKKERKKNFEISLLPACAPNCTHTYTLTHTCLWFLNRTGCYLAHFKSGRGTVHLLIFSFYTETHPAEHIIISASHNIGNSMYPLYLCLSLKCS